MDATSSSTVYDTIGEVQTSTDANGNTTAYGYDTAGRRTSVTDAIGNITSFVYDPNGNQASMTDARGNVMSYQYDKDNRRTGVVYADGTTDQTGYDAVGRNASKTDQAGKVTQYGYDADGRLTSVTDAMAHVTTYGYDEIGEEITQTDANNHATTFQYDTMGRRVKRTLPAGQSESYSYNSAGNLVSHTDFNGKTTVYSYDSMNRLLSKTPDASFASVPGFPSGTFSAPITFSYTPTGRRATMTDPSGTTSYSYDSRDRLTSKATPEGTLAYSYDVAGNVLSVQSSNANGVNTSYSYDKDERLATVTDNASVVTGSTRPASGVTAYSYDSAGNLSGFLYPNGVLTSYVYNTLNRLTSMTVAKVASGSSGSGGTGTNLASYAYTLGPAGNRTAVQELSGRTVSYSYDDIYRLTAETISSDPTAASNGSISYSYDAVGNRQSRTSTIAAVPSVSGTAFDADDRLSTDSYDANGSTIKSGANTYAYDSENHIVGANPGLGNAITILYDGDGNRVSKTVGASTSAVTTKYLVDTNNPTGYAQVVEELTSAVGGAASPAIASRAYICGNILISQSQLISSAWTTSFYGSDGHGSIRFLTDSSGSITDGYDYDAFGILIHQTGSTPNLYLYSGEQFDRELKLSFNRSRYLDPQTGRFWTLDKFEGDPYAPSSLHKYLYCGANPVSLSDPNGYASITPLINLVRWVVSKGVYVTAELFGLRAHQLIQQDIKSKFPGTRTEYIIPGGRIDVIIPPNLVYEIKPAGGTESPEGQIQRYLEGTNGTKDFPNGLIRGTIYLEDWIDGPYGLTNIFYYVTSPGVIEYEAFPSPKLLIGLIVAVGVFNIARLGGRLLLQMLLNLLAPLPTFA